MRTIFWWLLSLMLALTAPLARGEPLPAQHALHPAMHQAMHHATPRAMDPCPMHPTQVMAAAQTAHPDQPDAAPADGPTHRQPCGDCSACHVVALLPPVWLPPGGPDKVAVAPNWHPDLGAGRPEACELYRPPRA